MNRRMGFLTALIGLCLIASARAEEAKPRVDVARAKQLVTLGVGDPDSYEAPWGDETGPPESRWILIALRRQHSTAQRSLAVNAQTGDVWDRDACRFLSTPALTNALAEIKQSFGADEASRYDRLHAEQGDCLPDEARKSAKADAALHARQRAFAIRQNRILPSGLPPKIDADRAKQLLLLGDPALAGDDLSLDREIDDLHPMIRYSVDRSGTASEIYEINPWTGGVWNTETCVWLSTPALVRAQAEIRRLFAPAELTDYGRARRLERDCALQRKRWWAETRAVEQTVARRIASERRARELVVLADPGASVSSLDLQSGTGDFYVFQGLGETSGSYGYFAVNPWTGDVWSMWDCLFLTTPAVARAQAKIRAGYPAGEQWKYRRLHEMQGECMTD